MATRCTSTFVAAALLALSAPAPAEEALTVVDSNGKVLGQVVDTADISHFFFEVATKAGGRLFIVSLNRTQIRFGPLKLYYESADCSGPAYFDTCSPFLTGCSTVGPGNPGHSLYSRVTGASRIPVTAGSVFNNGSCDSIFLNMNGLPAMEVANLESLFTPPFRLRPSTDLVDILE